MPMRDPDAAVVAVFKSSAVKHDAKSAKAGRPVFEDREEVELRYPGSKNYSVHPATGFSHWESDPISGEQVQVTYAERFAHQYRQFKAHAIQTKAGTPLSEVMFLTEARRAELRAFNIYTVEALAVVEGQELKNLGPHGRDLKNKAIEYLDEAKGHAPSTQLQAELEEMKLRNKLLEEDNERLKQLRGQLKGDAAAPDPDNDFEAMTLDQLRDFIATNTGHAPRGAINRKTLIRMARDAKAEAA
jgi:hypothetical protein